MLREVLPAEGLVLELASGTGQHAVFLAAQFPGVRWQPTDAQPEALASIEAWRAEAGAPNVLPALALDATSDAWPVSRADAIVCINMIHISPWEATVGLMRGAARVLPAGGKLILYGPYLREREGIPTAPSNRSFDEGLRAQNPAWGVRELSEVSAEAARHGLTLARVVEMPSNNLTVVFDFDLIGTG